MRLSFIIALSFFHFGVLSQEVLVVWHSSNQTDFIEQALPGINNLATQYQLKLIIEADPKSLPEGVTSLPAIAYRSGERNVLFSGRYIPVSNVANFIRRARLSNGSTPLKKDSVFQFYEGRMRTAIQLKVTQIQGDPIISQAQIIEALETGFSRKLEQQELIIQPTDRLYYLDLHPYCDDSDIFLSWELYAQFNCIEPIQSNLDDPWIVEENELSKQSVLFAKLVEQRIQAEHASSEIGGRLLPVSDSIDEGQWSQFGGDLEDFTIQEVNTGVGPVGEFQFTDIAEIDNFTPIISFGFPSPLERYSGEVKEITGQLEYRESS
ncbi:MAG: hypothetical protein AAF193_11695, partial [Bacteroidota bacterium]